MGIEDFIRRVRLEVHDATESIEALKSNTLVVNLEKLSKLILADVTDEFLDTLLLVMGEAFKKTDAGDLIFPGLKKFRGNIDGFKGRYLFVSREELPLCAAAVFKDGGMRVLKDVTKADRAIENWDVIVKFRNSKALRDFLFSEDQDILNLMLTNDVEVAGNLNYIFKFGFMSRDLLHRTGLDKLMVH